MKLRALLCILAAAAPLTGGGVKLNLRHTDANADPIRVSRQERPRASGETVKEEKKQEIKQLEKNPEHGIKKGAKRTLKKLKKVDILDLLRKELDRLLSEFLPGWSFSPVVFVATSLVVAASGIWFGLFFRLFYENDRQESLSRWGPEVDHLTPEVVEANAADSVRPDLVIVFHHPQQDLGDAEHGVSHHDLHRTLVADVDSWKVVVPASGAALVRELPREDAKQVGLKKAGDIVRGFLLDGWVCLEGELGYIALVSQDDRVLEPIAAEPSRAFRGTRLLMKAANTWEMSASTLEHLGHAARRFTHHSAAGEGAECSSLEAPTLGTARVALLQDLFATLPTWGLDLHIFSSIDYDELYVCITLQNQQALSTYMLRHSMHLPIRKEVIQSLNIKQPPEELASSPPKLRYDPRMVQQLHLAQVLKTDEPRELYQTHAGRGGEGSILSGKDRFRVIFKELSAYLDLDAARHDGMIVDWYPSHSKLWLCKLEATWASYKMLFHFSFVQPLYLIHEYFGARVAFIFAWNGLYCKALLALSLLSVVAEVAAFVLSFFLDTSMVYRRMVLAHSLINIIWARAVANLWDRESEYFMSLWEINPDRDQSMRPSFQGEKMPSKADLNILEKQYSVHKYRLRQFISAAFTLLFCLTAALCNLVWLKIFEGNMDIYASVCLALIIFVFSTMYDIMVPSLTNWENHKFQASYYDSFLWKQFVFQAVNRYYAFFHLAMRRECPARGCLPVLREQCIMTLIILSVTRIAEVVVQSWIVRFKLWYEDYQLKKARSEADGPLPKRSFIEVQSKFAEARLQEQIQNMLSLVLVLGFILFFGAVAPIIVPFCLAVFTVQLRASAFVMLKYTKRTLPRTSSGIGLWRDIVGFLMQLSIAFSGFLIAVYGDTFAGTPLVTKVAGVILYYISCRTIWLVVDIACPGHSAKVDTMNARRQRVRNVILQRSEAYRSSDDAAAEEKDSVGVAAFMAEQVLAGKWGEIPIMHSDKYDAPSPTTL